MKDIENEKDADGARGELGELFGYLENICFRTYMKYMVPKHGVRYR